MALWPGCELNCHSCGSINAKKLKRKKIIKGGKKGKERKQHCRRVHSLVKTRPRWDEGMSSFGESRSLSSHLRKEPLCLGVSPPLRSSRVGLLSRPVWIPLQEAAGSWPVTTAAHCGSETFLQHVAPRCNSHTGSSVSSTYWRAVPVVFVVCVLFFLADFDGKSKRRDALDRGVATTSSTPGPFTPPKLFTYSMSHVIVLCSYQFSYEWITLLLITIIYIGKTHW